MLIVLWFAALVLLTLIHFAPTFIAFHRDAENRIWIFVVNLFFGWTLVGWFLALAWAIWGKQRSGLRAQTRLAAESRRA